MHVVLSVFALHVLVRHVFVIIARKVFSNALAFFVFCIFFYLWVTQRCVASFPNVFWGFLPSFVLISNLDPRGVDQPRPLRSLLGSLLITGPSLISHTGD